MNKSCLFTISLIGRPNVGKSTLFNRLVRRPRKSSIAFNSPGVTRDRHYGPLAVEEVKTRAILIDTGGLYPEGESFFPLMAQQVYQAMEESDLALLVLDGREGLHPFDAAIVNMLRKQKKEFWALANKCDSSRQDGVEGEFFALGVKEDQLFKVSAAHGLGLEKLRDRLKERVLKSLEARGEIHFDTENAQIENKADAGPKVKLAIVGMPNAGKSTLLNGLLGENRALVSDIPGTTTDPIEEYLTLKRHGSLDLSVVDTAGIRRKGVVQGFVESQAVYRSLHSMEEADIILYLLDAEKGAVHQDLRLIDIALEKGKSVIVCLNKIDRRPELQKPYEWQEWAKDIMARASWAHYCPILPLSAKEQKGFDALEKAIQRIISIRKKNIPTGELNRVIRSLVEDKTIVPARGKAPLKIKYASQITSAPPTFLLFSNRTKGIPQSYRRYLQNQLRAYFGLAYTPVRLIFRKNQKEQL